MFEVGFTEIILILGIALLVLGPEKLPRVAAQVGRWAGRARAMARNLKDQLDDEVLRAEQGLPKADSLYTPPVTPASDVATAAASIAASGAAASVVTPAPAADEAPASDGTAAPAGEAPAASDDRSPGA
ncbi:MAG: twin-arginine translocase subunit TatB [Steroidobacteraceae bacterium]|jgi:sec-independent protein translocase protein TatB|nr:twin-arginine translocase subunit TatB [Steroidobacteraceae bacterium]MCC7198289.1 twin-arginine translocase subunit TatB [Gammaproteobacteria bacterium]